jgi:hypothetical protein
VLALLGLAIVGGRVAVAGGAVEQAAASAAREASVARDPAQAAARAQVAAQRSLQDQGLQCLSSQVHVDVSGFARPVGQPASVGASVSCLVGFDGLLVPGMPGSRMLQASAASPLDVYRAREGTP